MQKELRVIKGGKYPVYGIAIPQEISLLLKGTFFTIQKSGTSILLTSGLKLEITEQQIESYKFEDCKI